MLIVMCFLLYIYFRFAFEVGDFGLARDLVDEKYYKSHGGQIPLRWTAPEALLYKKFSTASDVWSYAMVLYEIWSVGKKPFHTFCNNDVIPRLQNPQCLAPPPGCPRQVYTLMVDCWSVGEHTAFPLTQLDFASSPGTLTLNSVQHLRLFTVFFVVQRSCYFTGVKRMWLQEDTSCEPHTPLTPSLTCRTSTLLSDYFSCVTL